MKVFLMPEADDTILEICDFIDSINTENTSDLWRFKFTSFIQSYARANVVYELCRDESFALAGLSCVTFNGWVVAFKIEEDLLVVYQIVRGGILV
jgi:hypothetical protein